LKIASVETFHLVQRMERSRGPSPCYYPVRDTLLVKITTDDGLVGWGETAEISGTRSVIERDLAPRLIGENPLDTRRLWHKLWGANFGQNFAVSGLDIALHDLRGKALNLSIGQLYGGAFRDRVAAYAAGIHYEEGVEPEQNWVVEAAQLVEAGWRAIKIRIGKYPPAREIPLLEKVRAVVPEGVALLADGNAGYTLPTAIKVGRALERLGFGWFEEPLPQADYAAYEVLTATLDIAIAAGEALPSRLAFNEFLRRRAADIIQPDVYICGGVGEWLFISELARLARVPCMPHCFGGGIALAASAHLLSLVPEPTAVVGNDLPMLEVEVPGTAFQTELLVEPLRFVDSAYEVPKGPGLGVEINEDVLRAYSVDE
jgi:D-galactarolactone cycloisomerase